MPDIEERLGSALRAAGDHAPDATGLAGVARGRATARRRRRTIVAVAASVAVLAVVGGAVALGSRGGDGTPVAGIDTAATTAPATAGRVETWHDASVSVPASWGHGALSTWCTHGEEPGTPVVERPGGVVESIACDPVSGYGVRFSQSSDFWAAYSPGAVWQYSSDEPMPDGSTHVWPDGAWLGYVVTGSGTMVEVAAPTRDEARSVLGSFEQVTVADANGCPPQLVGEPSPVAEGSLRLCRYASDGWLEQSETLSGEDALKAAGALTAAPTRSPTGCPESANPGGVRLSSADLSGIVRTEGTEGCPGVFGWGGEERDLTRDVLYWVLSPGWSGQIPGGIRMDELRR